MARYSHAQKSQPSWAEPAWEPSCSFKEPYLAMRLAQEGPAPPSPTHFLGLVPSHPWKAPEPQRKGVQDNWCQGSKSPWFLSSQAAMTKVGYQAGSCRRPRKSGIKHRLGQKTQCKSARLGRINSSLLASELTVLGVQGLPGEKQGAGFKRSSRTGICYVTMSQARRHCPILIFLSPLLSKGALL